MTSKIKNYCSNLDYIGVINIESNCKKYPYMGVQVFRINNERFI